MDIFDHLGIHFFLSPCEKRSEAFTLGVNLILLFQEKLLSHTLVCVKIVSQKRVFVGLETFHLLFIPTNFVFFVNIRR